MATTTRPGDASPGFFALRRVSPGNTTELLPSGLTRRVGRDEPDDQRLARTLWGDAIVKRFRYDDHDQLRRHLHDVIDAYNVGRQLKTLKGLTSYEFACKR